MICRRQELPRTAHRRTCRSTAGSVRIVWS